MFRRAAKGVWRWKSLVVVKSMKKWLFQKLTRSCLRNLKEWDFLRQGRPGHFITLVMLALRML
ncbi:hypothetical protein CsSME_00050212 [Camellia sinensis var. sinensis]